jgi:hypothetical protein
LGPTSRSDGPWHWLNRCRQNQQTSNRQEQRVSDAQPPTPTCGSSQVLHKTHINWRIERRTKHARHRQLF